MVVGGGWRSGGTAARRHAAVGVFTGQAAAATAAAEATATIVCGRG